MLHERYRLLHKIDGGGMASVWLADDSLLRRRVALKELVLLPGATDLPERRARAMLEARAMARVNHEAIVRILDVFVADGDPWIVMDYIEGRSLARILAERGRLDERAVARIALPVVRGLGAVHAAGVVHRDVKPANIVVARNGKVFLVDFGIAKVAGDIQLTGHANRLIGTTEFIAPERIRDVDVGPASDLWSLGVTLFCALEGYSPFLRRGERGQEATLHAILHDPLPPLATRGSLADVILRLLGKNPSQRPGQAEVAGVLDAILAVPRRPAPGPRPVPKPQPAPKPRPAPAPKPRPAPAPRPQPDPRAVPVPRPAPAPPQGLTQAREQVRNAGPEAGAALLLAMPDEHAARILAGYPARLAGAFLQVIAATRPRTAAAILPMLSSQAAGRAVDHLSPQAGTAILAAMPVPEAERVLRHADSRTTAGMITQLPADVTVRLVGAMVRAMHGKQAATALEHLDPAVVADLIRDSGEARDKLLGQFTPSFRALVLRHL